MDSLFPSLFLRLSVVFFCSLSLSGSSSQSESTRDRPLHELWEDYKMVHDKVYDAAEEPVRMMLFILTEANIRAHNALNIHPYKLVHNHFSDLSERERKEYLGITEPENKLFQRHQPDRLTEEENAAIGLQETRNFPRTLDYRTDPCVGPIKNQGRCGSCWAFTTVSVLEFSYCKKNNDRYVPLSEQRLVDCDVYDYGCVGGWPSTAFAYLQSFGTVTNASYPYTAKQGICRLNNTSGTSTSGIIRVASYGNTPRNVAAMKAALLKYGPLVVTLDASSRFQQYDSGIFMDFRCSRIKPNHAVTLVGYGSEGAIPYWILKNQWGSKWGEGGYVRMLRGVNVCGIESHIFHATAA